MIRLRWSVAFTSALMVLLGCAWWYGDTLFYFEGGGDQASTSLLALVPRRLDAALAVLLGLLGLVASRLPAGRPLAVLAGIEAFAFLVLAGDLGVLVLLAYLMVFGFPLLLIAALAWGAARSRAARVGLGLVVATVATALLTLEPLDSAAFSELGHNLAWGVRNRLARLLVMAFLVGHGLLWAVIGVRAARVARAACASCGRPGAKAWVIRWGTRVTVFAASCSLPYFLLRMTWLTDSPLGGVADDGMRLAGILLGLIGLVSAVLTMGLVLPWGRVFPRWLPAVGGRRVPVLLPTLMAGFVGAVMTVAGRSMLQAYAVGDRYGGDPDWMAVVILPFPLWGPALMLAAYAYYLRYRGRCERCGRDDQATVPSTAARTA